MLGEQLGLHLKVDRPSEAFALLKNCSQNGTLPIRDLGTDRENTIKLELDADCSGKINRLLIEQGFEVTHLSLERQDLESFFLRQTSGGDQCSE
ncbi:MAG: hypothetical protein LBM70_07215 [Victivallales bacterium]|nr:hypothetical protein [Victivallales bacterium]